MLPDFPDIKRKLADHFEAELRRQFDGISGPFAETQKINLWEADRTQTQNEDGSIDERPLRHAEASSTISTEELERLPQEEILQRIYGTSVSLVAERNQFFLDSIDKFASDHGRVMRSDGEITTEAVLMLYEQVDIDFDEEGKPIHPSILAPGRMYGKANELFPELENNPDNAKKLNDILSRKYEEYRDREAARKLVG